MESQKLDKNFFQRKALVVARELLGKELVRVTPEGPISGLIVETEAYVGQEDLACHARFGKTARNKIMFESGGYAYVYLIYGIYYNFNITVGQKEQPEAVLVRSLEPRRGQKIAKRNLEKFGRVRIDRDIMTGPGKLCVALDIDKSFYGEDITRSETLLILDLKGEYDVATSPRVGIDYAGEYKDKPWRFFVKNNRFVSRSSLKNKEPGTRRSSRKTFIPGSD